MNVSLYHKRNCEIGTGLVGQLLGRWFPHKDGNYYYLRWGGEQTFGYKAKELEEKYCFEKNGIRGIVSTSSWQAKRKLRKLMAEAE